MISRPELVMVLLWIGLTAYAVFAGADFGAGFWDLTAGRDEGGRDTRKLAEHAIAPVWEANHVWLIYVLVLLGTGFPTAFASVMSTLFIPLTGAAVGIILRGSGFAFRKVVTELRLARFFGATFASSSVITPFFLGGVAGAVASGRVPVGNAAGDPLTSWWNPTSALGGTLAVATCAFLASVFLCVQAVVVGDAALIAGFRRRALAAGIACGVIALGGIAVLRADAPFLFHGLTHRGLPLALGSGVGGAATLVLVWQQRYRAARVTAVSAVVSVLWGWAAAQYPFMLEGSLTIDQAAGARATQMAIVIAVLLGTVVLLPSLSWLLRLAERGGLEQP